MPSSKVVELMKFQQDVDDFRISIYWDVHKDPSDEMGTIVRNALRAGGASIVNYGEGYVEVSATGVSGELEGLASLLKRMGLEVKRPSSKTSVRGSAVRVAVAYGS